MKRTILILVLLLGCPQAFAETNVSENALKSAFIYHFISFTEWNDDEAVYYVCIPEDNALRETAQESFRGKTINNRKIMVVDHSAVCHVLVSDHAPSSNTVMTIGRLGRGALLEFREIDHKIRFAVNLSKIQKSRFKISSQLLKLAILDKDSS